MPVVKKKRMIILMMLVEKRTRMITCPISLKQKHLSQYIGMPTM